MRHAAAAELLADIAKVVAPPLRRSVTDSATAVVRLQSASGAVMPWSADITPYMREPMDMLESRQKQALIFVGPAQSGKTQGLIDCWIGHIATCSPSDCMIIQATQSVARDYERDHWRRLKRNSAAIAEAVSTSGHDDNTYDKTLRSGDIIYIKWPSENELQGKSIRRMALTDYDRMPANIGGQGNPFDLARKRTRKYRSLAMTLVESSPGHEQKDPQWSPASPHQAPPAQGILALYNLGDRNRLYWPCPHCNDYFMSPAGPEHFHYQVERDLLDAPMPETLGEVGIICPACAAIIDESHRPAMLAAARWVPDGCKIDSAGRIDGAPPITDIASYWLHGVHAAFVSWRELIRGYLQAMAIYQATGGEESLRTVIMQDFGAPYVSQSRQSARSSGDLEARAETGAARVVPLAVRYLTAAVDIQANRFVVQIIGHGPRRERWLIDRYDIQISARRDHAGEQHAVDPAAYTEDWDLLTERVILASYPVADTPGHRLSVRLSVCDSGGRAGVTRRAYDYYRRLRKQGLAHRFALIKGVPSNPSVGRQPTINETYPDNSARVDRRSGARGDIPVYLLNVNELKDALDADLKRTDPGPGYLHIPAWITTEQPNWYRELTAEIRTEKGWEPADGGGKRNETWDLLVYDAGADLIPQDQQGIVSTKQRRSARNCLPAARIDWDAPPAWAGPLPANTELDNHLDIHTGSRAVNAADYRVM